MFTNKTGTGLLHRTAAPQVTLARLCFVGHGKHARGCAADRRQCVSLLMKAKPAVTCQRCSPFCACLNISIASWHKKVATLLACHICGCRFQEYLDFDDYHCSESRASFAGIAPLLFEQMASDRLAHIFLC